MAVELLAALGVAFVLIVHILAQAVCTWITKGGIRWGMGTRDGGDLDRGAVAGRIDRALRNFLETLPLFILALILMREMGVSNGLTTTGALLYVVARALYLPIYASGVPVIRSLIWGVATVGPILMLAGVLTGTQL